MACLALKCPCSSRHRSNAFSCSAPSWPLSGSCWVHPSGTTATPAAGSCAPSSPSSWGTAALFLRIVRARLSVLRDHPRRRRRRPCPRLARHRRDRAAPRRLPPGHILIIPRNHISDFRTDPVVAATIMQRTAEPAHELGITPTADGGSDCNTICNAGAASSQSVFHHHQHLLPAPLATVSPCPGPTRSAPHRRSMYG
ncbi:HIT domain-containing protein [Streptomyces sp. NPDC039022]|uniref:HIT family protein n=1 Tax=Streptomyces sp. NPDC039022 TaxID=3157091 RepID=UPI0033F43944